MISSSDKLQSGFKTMNALPVSPHFLSGTPMIAASAISGS